MFLLIVLAPVLIRQAGRPPFRLAWWSISFPLAALAVAGLRYANATGGPFTLWLGAAILAAATLAIAWVSLRTVYHLLRGDLLAPEMASAKAPRGSIGEGLVRPSPSAKRTKDALEGLKLTFPRSRVLSACRTGRGGYNTFPIIGGHSPVAANAPSSGWNQPRMFGRICP